MKLRGYEEKPVNKILLWIRQGKKLKNELFTLVLYTICPIAYRKRKIASTFSKPSDMR